MNRFVKGLLRTSVFVPVAAAATVLGVGVADGMPDAARGAAAPAPDGRAVARPAPSAREPKEQGLGGQANGVLNEVDGGLGTAEEQVVEVLTAQEAEPSAPGPR